MHWLLRVVVRYFWIAILGMIVYETYLSWHVSGALNGIVAGAITLFIGLIVWGALFLVLLAANLSSTVSQTMSSIDQMQRTFSSRRPPYSSSPFSSFSSPNPFDRPDIQDENVVEGTITDLDEERRKRRRE